jgi:hypothetical protein
LRLILNLTIYTLTILTWFGIIYGIVTNDVVFSVIGVLCGLVGLLVVGIRGEEEGGGDDTTT